MSDPVEEAVSAIFPSVQAFVERAMSRVAERTPQYDPENWEFEGWIPDGPDHFRRGAIPEPAWQWVLQEERFFLELPEAGVALSKIATAPGLSDLMGSIVSNGLVGAGVGAETILTEILRRHLARVDANDGLRTAVARVVADLLSPTMDAIAVAPFLGLECEDPVELGDGVRLDRLTDSEVDRFLDDHMLGSTSAGKRDRIYVGKAAGLKLRRSQPKDLQRQGVVSTKPSRAQDFGGWVEDEVRRFFGLLCLEDAEVRIGGFVIGGAWPVNGIRSVHYRGGHIGGLTLRGARLDVPAQRRLRARWTQLHRAGLAKKLDVSLRRLGYAEERTRSDDSIVDLMIACESFFLSEIGNARDRGELKFRVSLRAAYYLGETPEERSQFFAFMKRAYDVRSILVHGDEPDAKVLRGHNGREANMGQFADDLKGCVRRMIAKQLDGNGEMPDWDRIVLGTWSPSE